MARIVACLPKLKTILQNNSILHHTPLSICLKLCGMGKTAAYSILNANSLGDKRSGGYKYLMINKSTFSFLLLVEIVYALITTIIFIFMKYVYYNFLQFPTLLLDMRPAPTCPPKQMPLLITSSLCSIKTCIIMGGLEKRWII